MYRVERMVRRLQLRWQIRELKADIVAARRRLPHIDNRNSQMSQERFIDSLLDQWTQARRELDSL